MGLMIEAEARLPRRGLLKRPVGQEAVLSAIGAALEASVPEPVRAHLMAIEPVDGALYVDTHPAAEPIEITLQGGHLRVAAKTSTVGPGYHAWLIDFLDQLAASLELTWSIDDETEYARTRDFDALQHAFASFLGSIASAILEQAPTDAPVSVNTASDWTPQYDAFSLTPCGPLDRQWWQAITTGTAHDRIARAPDLFPWCDAGTGPEYWLGIARVLIWLDVPWRPPINEHEQRIYEILMESLDRAGSPMFDAERAEIEAMATADTIVEPTPTPTPTPTPGTGIGYRRGHIIAHVMGGWSVTIPGHFADDIEDEGRTLFYGDGERNIRVTTMQVPAGSAEKLVPTTDAMLESVPDGELLELDSDRIIGRAVIGTDEEDGAPYFLLAAGYACDSALCQMTVTYQDPADRAWAEAVFNSVACNAG